MAEFLQFLYQSLRGVGSRSSALTDLRWLIAFLLVTVVGGMKYGAPTWLMVGLAVSAGVCAIAYFAAYFYFMLKAPDALRSERFVLNKMAIRKGMIGDDLSGKRAAKPVQSRSPKLLTSDPTRKADS